MPHLYTNSSHSSSVQVLNEAKITSCQKKEEREAHPWERNLCVVWFIVLALYWLFILRKFCWVFFPMRVSQDKCCVSCDCVSLSDPIYAIVI
jgi:hypothetical protein